MRMVLRPSDKEPSLWRRLRLSLYGVTAADLLLIDSLWRPGADAIRTMPVTMPCPAIKER